MTISQQTDFSYRRINVVGTSGSGKTTFGQRLAAILNLDFIQIDQIFWGPDWYLPTDAEFFPKLKQELTCRNSWVLDGNYARTTPIKWENVEAVIWLDYSFIRTLYQALKRALKRAITQEEIWPDTGNKESFKKSFFSRDSIILWTITTYGSTRKKYNQCLTDPRYSHIRFIRFRSISESHTFLKHVSIAFGRTYEQ